MSRSDTWMPLYVADYARDTLHLTTEQHGAYMLLLMACWTRGGDLPADDGQLAGIARMTPAAWRRMAPVILAFFRHSEAGGWSHKRVKAEHEKAATLSAKRSGVGASGAEARWGASDGKTRSQRLSEARERGTHTTVEWVALQEAIGPVCVKCLVPAGSMVGGSLCKDHILPIYKGGSDALENLQPLCRECNAGKGDDQHDHRESASPGWRERVAKCLANARQATGPAQIARPSPSPPPSEVSEAAIASSATTRRAKPRQAAPDGWTPTDAGRRFAIERGMPPEAIEGQVERFRDHHAAKGSTFANVDAAWRTWAGNFNNFMPQLRVAHDRDASRNDRRSSAFAERLSDVGAAGEAAARAWRPPGSA